MSDIQIVLKRPHKGQQYILDNRKRFNVACMGRRWGKSQLGIQLAAETFLNGGGVGWFSPNFKTVLEQWREFQDTFGQLILNASMQTMRMVFRSGGFIDFWALDDDPEACRGRGYGRVIIDEGAKCRHLRQAWVKAIRPTLAKDRGDAYFFSTPAGKNYFWELANKAKDPEQVRWQYFHAPTKNNPLIHEEEIEDMAADMGGITSLEFRQEVLAEFLEGEGMFFSDFKEDIHTCLPVDAMPWWKYFGGFDWGYESPSCFLLFAVDDNDRIYCIDEWYAARKTDEQQAIEVKALLLKHHLMPSLVPIYSDTGMWGQIGRAQGMAKRPVDTFFAQGLSMLKATKDRKVGWRAMRGLFNEYGKIKFFKGRCPNVIREILEATHSEKDIEDINTDISDHAIDAARYALIQYRSLAIDPEKPQELPPPDVRPDVLKNRDGGEEAYLNGTSNLIMEPGYI